MEETIQTLDRVFSGAGITIFSVKNWESKLWLSLQVFNVIIVFIGLVFAGGYVIVNVSDISACIAGACIWVSSLMMFILICICFIFRRAFRQFLVEMVFKDAMLEMPLIEYVLKLEQAGRLNELKAMVVESREKLYSRTRLLLKIYLFSLCTLSMLYYGDSVYKMFTREDDSLRLLGIEMWIPWSLQNFDIYLPTYVFNVYFAFLGVASKNLLVQYLAMVYLGRIFFGKVFPGFQVTIILLVGQVVRQLRILTFILENLDELVMEIVGHKGRRWQTYCTSIMAQCVDHYIKLNRFSNALNDNFRPFYLALILNATMVVVMCSVKIAMSNKLSPDTMKYYVHDFCYMMMVLMFCTLGQQVENECARLEAAVTENWYIFDRTHKVHVRIFKMALSQRMPIYIFGTITLSAPTFTWVLKTGMSFFTLIMSVLDEN